MGAVRFWPADKSATDLLKTVVSIATVHRRKVRHEITGNSGSRYGGTTGVVRSDGLRIPASGSAFT